MNANKWHWRDGVLTCELLASWNHGFFTRSHSPKLPQDLHHHLADIGKAYRAKQVHGNRLVTAQEIETAIAQPDAPLPEADGVWAVPDHGKHSVWVCTADCVPVLIGDLQTGAVAAVHAGWRGTAAGIVTKAIATLVDQGSELKNLRIALGPAISGQVYQVSQEVVQQVMATVSESVGIDPDPDHADRARLDLRRVQLQQFQEIGINPDQVAIAPYCTLQAEEIFFSYRRYCLENPHPQPRSPQVQWSGIAIS